MLHPPPASALAPAPAFGPWPPLCCASVAAACWLRTPHMRFCAVASFAFDNGLQAPPAQRCVRNSCYPSSTCRRPPHTHVDLVQVNTQRHTSATKGWGSEEQEGRQHRSMGNTATRQHPKVPHPKSSLLLLSSPSPLRGLLWQAPSCPVSHGCPGAPAGGEGGARGQASRVGQAPPCTQGTVRDKSCQTIGTCCSRRHQHPVASAIPVTRQRWGGGQQRAC